MAIVKSPLGTKEIKNGGFRTFEVPDGDEMIEQSQPEPKNFNESLNKIKKAEEAAESRRNLINGKEKLSPGALDRISVLLGLTQLTREVDFGDGLIFVLKSLKTLELRDVYTAAANVKQFEMPFEMRRQHLARVIKSISNLPFEEFISAKDLEAKLAFVDELDEGVAVRLYDEFLILKEEVLNKYSIKTEEESKEIVENLKK